MTDPFDPAPRALLAAREILSARGASEAALLLEAAELSPAGEAERWEVGSRRVQAQAFALLVDPRAFVRLRDAALFDAVKEAIGDVMRSPTTELARLSLVVRLPEIRRSFADVYRSVTHHREEERPSDARVLAGASELAQAMEDSSAVKALAEALLESADVPSSGDRSLRRFTVRLPAEWLARAEKDRDLAERLRWLIEHAGARALEGVAGVELLLRLRP